MLNMIDARWQKGRRILGEDIMAYLQENATSFSVDEWRCAWRIPFMSYFHFKWQAAEAADEAGCKWSATIGEWGSVEWSLVLSDDDGTYEFKISGNA